MPAPPKDEDFLSRWSRRKQAEAEAEVQATPVAEPDPELSDEELLAELDLPDPDTMTSEDDFSAFMRTAVPERLRRRALRVLWRSNPVLANLDELVDYGEDFTDSATVIENMQTVYEVGKGAAEKWKRHLAALADEVEHEEPDASPPSSETASPPPSTAVEPVPDTSAPIAPEPVMMTESVTPPPRHMRFSFD